MLSEWGSTRGAYVPAVVWCTHCTVECHRIIEGLEQQRVSNLTSAILFADRLVRQLLLLSTLTKCTPLCSLHEWRVLLHFQKSRSKKRLFLSELLHEWKVVANEHLSYKCVYIWDILNFWGIFWRNYILFGHEWLEFCFEIKLMSIKHLCDKNLIKFCCLFHFGFFKQIL